MIVTHHIEEISFDRNRMLLKIDGRQLILELDKLSKKLYHASEIERNLYKVSPSGYGIHWPLIDEDLSVEALLK